MSRAFWMAVGAVGGIVAYRRGTRTIQHARELGPVGSAQAAASATSRLAGRTAHGLGRVEAIRARRAGRLVIGSVEADQVSQDLPDSGPASDRFAVGHVPASWVPVGHPAEPGASAPHPSMPARPPGHSAVVLDDEEQTEADQVSASGSASARTPGSTASATPRTTRARR